MLKIAYVGYDLSCLKTSGYFKARGFTVVYFIQEKQQVFPYQPFRKTDVFFNDVMVPADDLQRTKIQKAHIDSVQNDFSLLENALSSFYYRDTEKDAVTEALWSEGAEVRSLSQIRDVKYDSKLKKVFLEIENEGSESFDYFMTEAHPLVSQALEQNKVRIFKKVPPQLDYIWSSMNFSIDYLKPISPTVKPRMFFTVLDSSRRAIIDNWFFCHLTKDSLNVWSFQPFNQVHNPEFQNFYVDRVRNSISQKLSFVHIKDFQRSWYSTVGPERDDIGLDLNQALAIPNFTFWSLAQIENFLDTRFYKKLKKNKKGSEAQI